MSRMIADEMKRLHTAHETFGLKSRLAKAVGATPTATGEWLNGTTAPTSRYWPAIEAFFKLEPGHFREIARREFDEADHDTPEGRPPTPSVDDPVSVELAEIGRRLARLEEADLQRQATLDRIAALVFPPDRVASAAKPSRRRAGTR